MTLSLNRQPAADLIEGTAGTWLEAIYSNRTWERERDTPRFRQAFATLFCECDEWPSPAYFLRSLPAAPKQYYVATGALSDKTHHAASPQVQAVIDDLAKKLRVNL